MGKIFNKNCFTTECLMSWIPIVRWMREYKIKGLSNDVSAGIIVAIMNVSQSMAYAQIARLPPVVGLYSSFVPTLAYAILGT
uniref:Sulfate_transp domain-containing protein n=1 Tax=Strongyloides papillosus TaxID=174720 RepID=A0A0N5BMZ6_STREA